MSRDQEPSERQRLRHQLRDLHRMLTPDAPRAMTTSARAQAIIAKLQELAGDRSVGGEDVGEAAERAANRQASRGPRSRTSETGSQPRSRQASTRGAGASRASAAGVAYAEPEAEPEPERERGIDALIRWFREAE